MAFSYKSIGNTAAAVVSLLAVGTLCWWQRTPGPLNAPRPQDEAEIMTACLERHYSMLRTGTQFTIVRPEYVSQVPDTNAVGGVRYVTNWAAHALTNTIGFFPNATFNYPQSIRDALAPCQGVYGTANACVWALPSNTYWTTGNRDFQMTSEIVAVPLHTETNWWTNWVTLSTATLLSTVTTNVQTTNTVVQTGWKATSTLFDGTYYYVARWFDLVPIVGWLPDTVFADTGTPPESFTIDDAMGGNEYLSIASLFVYWYGLTSDSLWEGSSVDMSLPSVLVSAQPSGGDVTINYGTWTSYTYAAQTYLVTNITQTNTWTTKAFAFERDRKPYWWSTNAYNDMARALSSMQWQVNEAAIASCTNVVLQMYRTDSSQTNSPYTHSFTTNFSDATPYYGGYYPSTIYFVMQMGGTYTQDWPRSGGVFAGAMEGGIKCWRYAVTNRSPFAWTNVSIFVRLSTNNNYIADGATWTPTNLYNATIAVTNYLQSGAGAYSSWVPFEPSQAVDFLKTNMVAWSDNALPWMPPVIDFGIPASYLAVNENQGFDVLDRCSEIAQGYLPYVNVEPSTNVIAYRVQFSALTNYLNHAPAR